MVAINIFEVMKDAIEPFLDGEKQPLHVGEAYHLWYYLAGIEQTIRNDQIAYNITQDEELKEKMKDLINNVHKPMKQELTNFLRDEGVPVPPSSPEKPLYSDFLQIPEGAKLTDEDCQSDSLGYCY